MKILITGAKGFIGRNLILELQNRGYDHLCFCDTDTSRERLEEYAKDCQIVFHLAGVNRPQREEEFMEGNCDFTALLLELLKKHNNKAPIVCTSSTQALQDNPYGKSKLAGEELLLDYQKQSGAEVCIFRLTNVFGKWCKPNYNSVVATFCYNIARNLPIQIRNAEAGLNLIYIDDVVNALTMAIPQKGVPAESPLGRGDGSLHPAADGRYYVHGVHQTTLGELAGLLNSFRKSRLTLQIPNMEDAFVRKLYSTYLSYLPEEDFSYPLTTHADQRGSFTEALKQGSFGQISVNISKPGITKGDHWHHTKNEKFLVVSGDGAIRFRKTDPFGEEGRRSGAPDIGEEQQPDTPSAKEDNHVIEYKVSGNRLQIVDIPPGYTHSITNLGDSDMVTLMWANESFDPENPDTYFKGVCAD